MAPVLELRKVVKEYQMGANVFRALDNLSMTIERGEFVIILGPSGSGKTTLLNMISALDSPSKGRVFIDAKEITAMSEDEKTRFRAKHIGLVFQFFNLFPALTLLENVEMGVALKMEDPDKIRKRASKYLNIVGLGKMLDKYPSQLSGGEQQRGAVARALAMEPALLLADEPTGNLDAETSESVWAMLRKLNQETGTTVVSVTHWAEASELADRTIHLRSGRIESIDMASGRSSVITRKDLMKKMDKKG